MYMLYSCSYKSRCLLLHVNIDNHNLVIHNTDVHVVLMQLQVKVSLTTCKYRQSQPCNAQYTDVHVLMQLQAKVSLTVRASGTISVKSPSLNPSIGIIMKCL